MTPAEARIPDVSRAPCYCYLRGFTRWSSLLEPVTCSLIKYTFAILSLLTWCQKFESDSRSLNT